jgi:predicted DNA-binding transcriptional regulator YafY
MAYSSKCYALVVRQLTTDKDEKTRLERLVAIEERISNNQYPNMRALCQAFNVKPRTIYADIRLLRERFGIDIRFDRFRNGYYNANPGKRIPIGDLVEDDYLLIIAGCAILSASFGTRMKSALQNVVSNLGKRLSFGVQEQLNGFVVKPNMGRSDFNPEVMVQLGKALLQNRAIELKVEGGSPHLCAPCALIEQQDSWYLLGYNLKDSAVEKHDLSKIARCDVKDDVADIDRKALVEQYLVEHSI